jgi:hypothetical protein
MSDHADTIRRRLLSNLAASDPNVIQRANAALAALDALLAENQTAKRDRDHNHKLYADAIDERDTWKERHHKQEAENKRKDLEIQRLRDALERIAEGRFPIRDEGAMQIAGDTLAALAAIREENKS